jgi:hypothetical protein
MHNKQCLLLLVRYRKGLCYSCHSTNIKKLVILFNNRHTRAVQDTFIRRGWRWLLNEELMYKNIFCRWEMICQPIKAEQRYPPRWNPASVIKNK